MSRSNFNSRYVSHADISKIYNNKADEYDNKYTSIIHQIEDRMISEMIERVITPNSSVFDIGCGTGQSLSLAAGINRQLYYGCDLSEDMIRIARKKHPDASFECRDASQVATVSFDTILAIFGQINYIGLESFADCVAMNSHSNTDYLFISYNMIGHEDYNYSVEHQKIYDADEIIDVFAERGIKIYVHGFSFEHLYSEIPDDASLRAKRRIFEKDLKTQVVKSSADVSLFPRVAEDFYKYQVITNVAIFKDMI